MDTSVDTTTVSNAPSFTTFNASRTNHGNSSTLNTERNTTRNKPAALNRNNNTAKNTTSLSKTQTTNQSIVCALVIKILQVTKFECLVYSYLLYFIQIKAPMCCQNCTNLVK